MLQRGVGEEGAEVLAHLSLEHVRVPVAVRAERRRGVVDVQCPQAIQADARVELTDELVDLLGIADVVARRIEVARVEAQPEPRVAAEPVEQRVQLLERASDRATGSGRVLDQEPGIAVAALEDLRKSAGRPVRPARKPAPRWEPTWKITPSAPIALPASTVACSAAIDFL